MAREGYEAAAEMIVRAEAELSRRGYTFSQSSLGDARYWTKECRVRIRTATYHHQHDATVDLVITPDRAREIALTDAEIAAIVDQAINVAEQMEAALSETDDESAGLSLDEIAEMSPAEVQRRLRGEG